MTNPTPSDVHVNTPLTNISIAYRQDNMNFIADQVFPVIPVQHQSDIYWEFKRDAFFRSDVEERAPAAESIGTEFNIIQSGPYYARVYAVHYDLPYQVRANADPGLNIDFAATELVTQQQLIKRDTLFLNKYFVTGIWTGMTGGTWSADLTGVASAPGANQFLRWDQAGSTPREDVRGAALHVKSITGVRPNVLVLGPYVTNALLSNPELIDAVKYTAGGIIGPEDLALLAKFFGVDRVLSAEAVNNTAPEGGTLSMGFLAGKSALLAYAPPNPGLMTPSAGYIFSWNGYLGGTSDIAISKWYSQDRKADRIESEMAFDLLQTGSDLGVFFATAVS